MSAVAGRLCLQSFNLTLPPYHHYRHLYWTTRHHHFRFFVGLADIIITPIYIGLLKHQTNFLKCYIQAMVPAWYTFGGYFKPFWILKPNN